MDDFVVLETIVYSVDSNGNVSDKIGNSRCDIVDKATGAIVDAVMGRDAVPGVIKSLRDKANYEKSNEIFNP